MRSVPEIIDDLGGISAVARWIDTGPSTVSEMKRRGTIHPRYWMQLVDGARSAGCEWLTAEYLAIVHAAGEGRLPLSMIPAPVPASPPAGEAPSTGEILAGA